MQLLVVAATAYCICGLILALINWRTSLDLIFQTIVIPAGIVGCLLLIPHSGTIIIYLLTFANYALLSTPVLLAGYAIYRYIKHQLIQITSHSS